MKVRDEVYVGNSKPPTSWEDVMKVADEVCEKPRMKTITVGIMSLQEFKQRTLDIAKGKYRPTKDEPRIFFESQEALEQYAMKVSTQEP